MPTDRLAAAPSTAALLLDRPAARRERPAADGFAALLDAAGTPERTAPAPVAERDERPEAAPADTAAATVTTPDPVAVAAPTSDPAAVVPAPPVPGSVLPATPVAAEPAVIPVPLPAPAVGSAAAPAPVAPVAPAPVTAAPVAAAPVAAPSAEAVAAPPVAGAPAAPTAAPAASAQPAAPPVPAEAPVATGGDTGGEAEGQQRQAPPATALPTAPAAERPAAEHTAAPVATAAPAPVVEAPAAPSLPAAQPAAPAVAAAAAAAPDAVPSASATSAAVAPPAEPIVSERPVERAVPLQRAPEAASAMLQMALDRNVSRARIALRPAELGGIEVQLKSTAAGVSARIVADSPEAARLLAAASDELRRSLEARDVTLVSLEIAVTGDDLRDAPSRGAFWDELSDTASSAREGDAEGGADPAAPDTVHSVVELPGGLLVDVLA